MNISTEFLILSVIITSVAVMLVCVWRGDTKFIEYNSGYELARRAIASGDKMTLSDIVTGRLVMSKDKKEGALEFIERHRQGYKL